MADDTDTIERPPALPPGRDYTPVPAGSIGTAKDYLDSNPYTKSGAVEEFIADQKEQLGKLDEAAVQREKESKLSTDETIAATKRQLADDQAAIKRRQQLSSQLPNAPKAPNLPPAPQQQFQDMFKAFQNPAVVLAGLASLATRAPMTAMFRAGAAAMEGFHKGDEEAIKQNVENWKNKTEQASKQFELEMQQFNTAMTRHHGKEAALQAELEAIAATHRDEIALAQIREKGSAGLWELKQEQVKAHSEMMKNAAQLQQQAENYQMRLAQERWREATQERREERLMKALQLRGDADLKADGATLGVLRKQQAAIGQYEQTAMKNMDTAVGLMEKVDDTGSPFLNKWLRRGEAEFAGNSDVIKLDAQMNFIKAEVARIMSNPNLTGALTDHARAEAEAFIKPGATMDNVIELWKLIKQDFKNRETSNAEQINAVQQRIYVNPTYRDVMGMAGAPIPAVTAPPSPPTTASTSPTTTPTTTLPPTIVSKLKKGVGTKLSDGSIWTLGEDGQPQKVQ